MHAAAIFVVEAHLAELQAEAVARRAAYKPGPSRFQRLIGAVRESLAARPEPFIPRLESYPYSK
jgi:hypothetical protein